jgi:uncharacterized membrane protein YbhN (UPF0104 family)
MGKTLIRAIKYTINVGLFLGFIGLVYYFLDLPELWQFTQNMLKQPLWLLLITGSYALAFIVRAAGWKLYVRQDVPFNVYLAALWYSLFFNHILPFKLGEAVRVAAAAQHPKITTEQALHSTLIMRLLDLLFLGILSLAGSVYLGISLHIAWFTAFIVILIVGSVLLVLLARGRRLHFLQKHIGWLRENLLTMRGLVILLLVSFSWMLESVVVYGVVHAVQLQLSFFQSIWINSLTVASSVFQFAPGGLATYESVMSFALVQTSMSWEAAFHIAIITHGFKFVFSFISGGAAVLLYPLSWAVIRQALQKKGARS